MVGDGAEVGVNAREVCEPQQRKEREVVRNGVTQHINTG